MPYRIERRRGSKPWKIVNTDTGRVVGASASRSKAEASVRARYGAEGGQSSRYGDGGSFARQLRRRRQPRNPAAIARQVLDG